MPDCIFCRIAKKEVPAKIVLEEGDVVAFHDTQPQAPTHVLVVPKQHLADLNALANANGTLGAELLRVCARVAEKLGLASGGYRVVANNGAGAGQSVFHLHLHVLGGRPLGWPPG